MEVNKDQQDAGRRSHYRDPHRHKEHIRWGRRFRGLDPNKSQIYERKDSKRKSRRPFGQSRQGNAESQYQDGRNPKGGRDNRSAAPPIYLREKGGKISLISEAIEHTSNHDHMDDDSIHGSDDGDGAQHVQRKSGQALKDQRKRG